MITSILDHLVISKRKSLHLVHTTRAYDILNMFPKRELRIVARRCGVQRSNNGCGDKHAIITNLLNIGGYGYSPISIEVRLSPK